MAYTRINFKTKKALREALDSGEVIKCYQPNGDLFHGTEDVPDGVIYLEGPHYPQPHRWYAKGTVKNNTLQTLEK